MAFFDIRETFEVRGEGKPEPIWNDETDTTPAITGTVSVEKSLYL